MSLQQPHSSPDIPSAINAVPIHNAQDLRIAFELGRRDFTKAELANADLSGMNLSGIHLRQANLQGANLTAANLQKSDLSGANLQGANLTQTDLQRSNLTRSNLQQAKLDHTNLHGANLSWSNLQNQDLRTAQLVRADLQGANLQQANLTRVALREAKLDAANLQSAIAIEADLSYAYMVYAQLAQADLRKATLTRVDLTGAVLEDCKLDQAKLSESTPPGARLRHANLQCASLQRAYLRHCNLQNANLTAANLQKADLSHAQLKGAILAQADLRGAELEQAKDANLESAIASTLVYQMQCVLHLKLGRTKAGYANFCPSLAFSPDGTMLAYTQAPYTVSLLHLETDQPLQSINIEPETLVSVVFSPDGDMLYEMSYINELKRWNPFTGQLIDDLKEHSAHVTAIALKGDLKGDLKTIEMMGVGSPTEKIELGHEQRTFWRYSQEIYTEAHSPDGKLIAKSDAKHPAQRGQIQLLDRQRGRRIRAFDGHQNAVQSLAFHPNGQLLAGKSTDACKLWDVNTGKELAGFYPHPPYVLPAIAFVQDTHNAPVLVSSILYQEFSKHKIQFDPSTNTTTRGSKGLSSSNGRAMISANGAVLARHDDGQLVQLWNIKTGRELGAVNVNLEDEGLLVAISSMGETIATLNRSTVSVWDVSTQALIQSIAASGRYRISAAFSPCGEQLAIGGTNGVIQLWNWKTGETVEFSGYCGVEAIAFSTHNPTPILAAGYSDGTIKFWNLQTMQEDLSFVAHEEAINIMAFSPDGKWLASSNRKNGVRLWHLR